MMYRVNIGALSPVWARVTFLLLIGIPPLTNWNFIAFEGLPEGLSKIVAWAGFAAFVWLFILLNVGVERLTLLLSASFVLALTTSLLGSVTRRVLPFLASDQSSEEIGLRMATLFMIMIAVIPYTLLFVSSFSAAGLARRVSTLAGRKRVLGIHGALALRVLQHVGEVFGELFTVWSEENPQKIVPRYHQNWRLSPLTFLNYGTWFVSSVVSWCVACLLHVLEPLPSFVHEFSRLTHEVESH